MKIRIISHPIKPVAQVMALMLVGSIALTTSAAQAQAPAFAGSKLGSTSVYFVPDGSGKSGAIETLLPLEKLGNTKLPRGRLTINGDTAEVSVIPEWQFDKHRVLTGKVLDTRYSDESGCREIRGVILFTGGEWYKFIDNPGKTETVITETGSTSGQIVAVQGNIVKMTRLLGDPVEIPLASITRVESQRTFSFVIPLGLKTSAPIEKPSTFAAYKVSLKSVAPTFQVKALKQQAALWSEDGDMPTSHLVLIGTALSLAELAQLAPLIVLPAATTNLRQPGLLKEFDTVNGIGQGAPLPFR